MHTCINHVRFAETPRAWPLIVVVASGPSLDVEQACRILKAQTAGAVRVIVVNDCWRMIPSADALYAADGDWWDLNAAAARFSFCGEMWTQDAAAVMRYEPWLRYIAAKKLPGLSRDPALLHTGGNSGYQAINLAFHFGARRIILCGFDMQRTGGKAHWFGNHPPRLRQASRPEAWVPHFDALAADLAAEGVDVINATPTTALRCFRSLPLPEALGVL